MIELHYKKNIFSTIHRCMVLMLLLCFFVLGIKAQEEWILEGTHATGIDNGVVYLNDLEDHNWTYYSGVDRSVDNGYYNDNYNGILYSPNPRNVKITYNANGGAVSITEHDTSFVYYKTLEQDAIENYPYTVISNPFSKRPTGKGFGGWKIIKGHTYIKRANGTMAAKNAVLGLDEEIIFTELNQNKKENCISAEIEFEATWIPAQVTYLADVKTDNTNYTFNVSNTTVNTTTYENNFLVINKTYSGTITVNSPCTIMMVEPDGSANYKIFTFSNLINPMKGGNTKIEFAHWKPSGNIHAQGYNFTIGRGMTMDGTTTRPLYGCNQKIDVNQILKVESGKFTTLSHYVTNVPSIITKQRIIFGCDYDRAKGDNSNLEFTGDLRVATKMTLPTNEDSEIFRTYSLSGKFVTGTSVGSGAAASCYYLSVRDGADKVLGHRYLEILGGEWKNLAGGWSPEHPEDKRSLTIRIKGGNIKGSIYGGAQHVEAYGIVTYIITGGTINGWIAGGANGTEEDRGELFGESYIYVGGDAKINSNGSTTRINRAVGGNVFGAGCGFSANSTSGQVTLGTNVVIADNAYVERGVYGGGSYGYCKIDQTSNIYITGGTVGGKAGGVNGTSYKSDIQGGVYGGACQNKGGSVNIFMTGGTVNGGIYGGSNASGVLSGNVYITIAGGNIGTQEKVASVFGGGYGKSTNVAGNVNIKYIGGLLNGSLFGGGNEGTVTGNTSVTITGGEIKQNVYGGGNKAAVSGTTNVVIGQ